MDVGPDVVPKIVNVGPLVLDVGPDVVSKIVDVGPNVADVGPELGLKDACGIGMAGELESEREEVEVWVEGGGEVSGEFAFIFAIICCTLFDRTKGGEVVTFTLEGGVEVGGERVGEERLGEERVGEERVGEGEEDEVDVRVFLSGNLARVGEGFTFALKEGESRGGLLA